VNTLSIERAEAAARFIDRIKSAGHAGEIRQELEGLPARIQVNGLLQTMVFLQELGNEDRKAVGADLLHRLKTALGQPDATALTLCNAANLCRATEEALAYAQWLKMLAKAEIPKRAAGGQVT